MGKGAVKRLADFLDQFVSDTPKLNAAKAELIYQFRPSLSRGGELSYSDRKSFLLGFSAEGSAERDLFLTVWQLVKISLVNWLHSRVPLAVPTPRRGRSRV